MGERSYSGRPLRPMTYGPWVDHDDTDGETVAGSSADDRGEETTTGTPKVENIHVSTAADGGSGDTAPGFEADESPARRELRELMTVLDDPAVYDLEGLADRYGCSRSKVSGLIAQIRRDRWSNEDYEVVVDS